MVNVVSREEWGARAPKHRSSIQLPTPENWLHHTAGSEAGKNGMQRIQNYHMDSKGWSDIGYSWVYDKDARTWYEGRGWGFSGAHTYGHNSSSHGFYVMGNFQNETVTDDNIMDIAWLVAEGHKAGKCVDKFTGGHRDVGSTSCPGDNLYNRIDEINAAIQSWLSGGSTSEPEEPASTDGWKFPAHANNLLEAGIYTKYTKPGYPIDSDNLSAYLDRIIRRSAGLVRIDGGNAVFQVVGEYLVPVASPAQAKIIVQVSGGAPSVWSKYVTNITSADASNFIKLDRGVIGSGGGGDAGPHTHSEYEVKGHEHSDLSSLTMEDILSELVRRLS